MSSPDNERSPDQERKIQHWGLVLWPSFLAACTLEVLIFALVDPGEIHWPSELGNPSRQSVYTVAFFAFWLITMVSSRLVLWMTVSGQDVNDLSVSDRPAD